ncbi:MAG: RHS domain-containing protein [Treponema sp.]|nr:RHS domain-containing protein [Treponema sp.]
MNYFSAIFTFPDNTKARFVKLHSLWDERDLNYSPLDFSSFKGNPWNLFEVYYLANGKEFSCSYDSRGNRLSEVESFSSSNASKIYFEYYQNSDLIKKAGNWYFNYDNNGNLLSRGNVAQYSNTDTFCSWDFAQKEGEFWVYEYDLQNRLIKTSYSGKGKTNLKERASYTYDYRGLLVRKSYQDYDKSNYIELDKPTSSKEITEYYEYTPDGRVLYNERKDNTIVNKTDYIWANTTLWCEINEGILYYHHTDHLGTTEVITDSNGNIVWHADYEAFGNVMNERGEENFTPNYTGKFFDKTTGLYYFNARWYDCELGRFTTQDPARDGVNWWAYCGGNPITFVDPDGREDEVVIKPYEPTESKRQVDSASGSLLPSSNYTQHTANQNKEQKALWGEATFVDGPGENSCHMQAGLYSISSELNNSPKNHHIYGQAQLDILNADFSASATDGGGGTGFSLNALSVSGSIGYQSDSAIIKVGGTAGLATGSEVKFDRDKGEFVFDVAFILGVRVEVNWKRDEK